MTQITKLLESKKLQTVFADKSHPRDALGRTVIAELAQMAQKLPSCVACRSGDDMGMARILAPRADAWLNNPRRPLEAWCFSGMNAAMNGVLNVSIPDGWWPEACKHGENGWAIGAEEAPSKVEEQDRQNVLNLCNVFEYGIIPTYYHDRAQWKKMMVESIQSCSGQYCAEPAERMVRDHFERINPARVIFEKITRNSRASAILA